MKKIVLIVALIAAITACIGIFTKSAVVALLALGCAIAIDASKHADHMFRRRRIDFDDIPDEWRS